MRGFLSYAHADLRLVDRFRRLLTPRLEIVRGLDASVWRDDDILVGQPWDDAIRTAIAKADFGLVLVSPALLSRPYIRDVEIPMLLSAYGPVVMPVGLQRVNFERNDLQGLDALQIFRHRVGSEADPKWYADLAGKNPARCLGRPTATGWRERTGRAFVGGEWCVLGPDGPPLSCTGEVWRWLRWRYRNPATARSTVLAAEHFGLLPEVARFVCDF